MTVRVDVRPELIIWARERSRIDYDTLTKRFPKLPAWEGGEVTPTLKQLEAFAQRTHTPVGYFFLPEPPIEKVPLPDFRTLADQGVNSPSPDLLDTIYQCQLRQDWYRDYALERDEPTGIFGLLDQDMSPMVAADRLGSVLDFEPGRRGSTPEDAFRRLSLLVEDLGVLVMVNGVVGSNTHRRLDPDEFRGFALADPYASVVFVNGVDSKAAQLFTLVHELVHIALGVTALSDAQPGDVSENSVERYCNAVAAEILVPTNSLARRPLDLSEQGLRRQLDQLTREYKVSSLVVLSRLFDMARFQSWEQYREIYTAERQRVLELYRNRDAGQGGDYYNTQPSRVSRRFARAVITSTLEGQTLYRDAFLMLGSKSVSTFNELGQKLGVA